MKQKKEIYTYIFRFGSLIEHYLLNDEAEFWFTLYRRATKPTKILLKRNSIALGLSPRQHHSNNSRTISCYFKIIVTVKYFKNHAKNIISKHCGSMKISPVY